MLQIQSIVSYLNLNIRKSFKTHKIWKSSIKIDSVMPLTFFYLPSVIIKVCLCCKFNHYPDFKVKITDCIICITLYNFSVKPGKRKQREERVETERSCYHNELFSTLVSQSASNTQREDIDELCSAFYAPAYRIVFFCIFFLLF